MKLNSHDVECFDAVIVGAGLGGIYAAHKFLKEGLKIVVLEKADEIGGVWNYNRYPGARVDVDSTDYSYSFSPELYREWQWSERYATQAELLRYLNHVVDRFDLRRHIRVGTALTAAQWHPDEQRYHLETGTGRKLTTRFLVMATGNLSAPRDPDIPGIADFKGQLLRTSRWPHAPQDFSGKRVGLIGTGSSGVQTTVALAKEAGSLTVFQRTAHYAIPARNGAVDQERFDLYASDTNIMREFFKNSKLFGEDGNGSPLGAPQPAASYSPDEQEARLARQWGLGGQRFHVVFADQTSNQEANDVVANFVRRQIRGLVKDPELAELLSPRYPIGTRRLIQADDYYECFNQENVSLVDISRSPIERVTETGIQTTEGHYDLDVIVLALGFKAFTGEINQIAIRNAEGKSPTDDWGRGPRTLFGLMTAGFPNFFTLTGAGSPAVLANLFTQNEYHADWVADCIKYLDTNGYSSIEPEIAAQDSWTERVASVALRLLRLQGNDYMVHRNEDGTRAFIPWSGGVDKYVEALEESTANGYAGFKLNRASSDNRGASKRTADLSAEEGFNHVGS